jgi:hypothetical protein
MADAFDSLVNTRDRLNDAIAYLESQLVTVLTYPVPEDATIDPSAESDIERITTDIGAAVIRIERISSRVVL